MKKSFVILMPAICLLFFGITLAACGTGNKGEDCWKTIVENTVAQTQKADANFRIDISDDSAPTLNKEIVVDGNKMKSDVTYWAQYICLENDSLYHYLPNNDEWYKAAVWVYPDGVLLKTVIQTESGNVNVLALLAGKLPDLENVKYESHNKYTYRYVAEGDTVDGTAEFGYDPVFDYTFITDGVRVTEVQLRGTYYKITYGGQTVVLPDAAEPTKLPAPQNLTIADGILSWDPVDGAGEYYVEIFMNGNYRGAQYEPGTTMNLIERLQSQPDIFTADSFEITVQAIFPVLGFRHLYDSTKSVQTTYIWVR